MDLLATLRRSGGIDALARQVGLAPAVVSACVEASLPAIVAGLRNYTLKSGGGDAGLGALLAMIDGLGDGNLAADVMGPEPLSAGPGERILAQFFEPSRAKQRAGELAVASGRSVAEIERILPLLAMLLCGYISARVEAGRIDGGNLDWLWNLLMLQDPDEPRANSGTHG